MFYQHEAALPSKLEEVTFFLSNMKIYGYRLLLSNLHWLGSIGLRLLQCCDELQQALAVKQMEVS